VEDGTPPRTRAKISHQQGKYHWYRTQSQECIQARGCQLHYEQEDTPFEQEDDRVPQLLVKV